MTPGQASQAIKRGCPSNRKLPAAFRARAVELVRACYAIAGRVDVLPLAQKCLVRLKGKDAKTGKPYVRMFFMNGGHGARPNGDGPGCLSFPSNVSNQSIEQFENQIPLIVGEKEFVADTGGA